MTEFICVDRNLRRDGDEYPPIFWYAYNGNALGRVHHGDPDDSAEDYIIDIDMQAVDMSIDSLPIEPWMLSTKIDGFRGKSISKKRLKVSV